MGEDGHLGYLPAGLSLDDLLRMAEEVQKHLPEAGEGGAPAPEAGEGEEDDFTPLDLAALVAAHAKRMKQQQDEARQLRAMEKRLQSQQGFPRPASGPGGAECALRAARLSLLGPFLLPLVLWCCESFVGVNGFPWGC